MNVRIRFISIAAILLTWLVTGCTPTGEPEVPVVQPTEVETQPVDMAVQLPEPTAVEVPPETTAEPDETEPVSTEETVVPSGGEDRWDTPALTRDTMVFTVEGMEEEVPVFSWYFGTYSVSIPAEDWIFDQLDDCERWTYEWNPDVHFSVYHFDGSSQPEAIQAFAAGGEYIYEDLLGGGSVEDCLHGTKWPMCCTFFATEDGTVIAWEYPAEAAEGAGARMHQMAATYASEKS